MAGLPERRLGDVNVSAIGMGAMTLTQLPGYSVDRGFGTVHAAVDAGITFFDTADCYGDRPAFGINEALLARALWRHGDAWDRVIVATKAGHYRLSATEWGVDGRPEHLIAACHGSLRRLRRDQLDLLQLHRPDPSVPFADSVGALKTLHEMGSVRRVGLCNVSSAQIRVAHAILGDALVSVQVEWSLLAKPTDDVLTLCETLGLAVLPWAPLGGLRQAKSIGARSDALADIASTHGVSPQRIVLASILARSPNTIPIPGASRPESVRDSARAALLALDDRELERLWSDQG